MQCAEWCPEIEIDVSISQLFTIFFSIFLKPHAQKHGKKGGKKRVLRSKDARKALAEKGRRPPLPFTTHPQPRRPHPKERRWRSGWRKQDG